MNNDIQRLTELIAAHGVYALTVIVIFYLQFWAKKNLDSASKTDHDYFKKWHASTWVGTWVMMIVSTLVWIYATFMYKPASAFIHGSVMDLVDQPVAPTRSEDPAALSEQIAPASRNVQLYESKQPREASGSTYDVDWLLVPREGAPTAVVFNFQHHYSIWKPQNAAFPLGAQNARSMIESKTLRRTFTIDMKTLHQRADTSLQLAYESDPADPVRNIGKLFLRADGAKLPIPWDDDKPATGARRTPARSNRWFALVPTLLAAGPSAEPAQMFDANGAYDPQAGRILRERLGNRDLKVQLRASAVLVGAGRRAFNFIRDSLALNETGYDRELLVTNLARALEDIGRGGVPAPADLSLQMASALTSFQDVEGAARFFDRAGRAPLPSTDLYFTRGYVYRRTKQCDRAIRDFETYLAAAKQASAKALAYTNIAMCREDLSQIPAAVDQYRAAIAIDPSFAMAYNNLAYLFAERAENLSEALKLSNRALELNKDAEDVPAYKDTKGWILFKTGQYQQAVTLLKEAATAAPNEPVIKQHFDQAQRRLGTASKS